MEELKNYIDVTTLYEKPVIGKEYYLVNRCAIGKCAADFYNVYFYIITDAADIDFYNKLFQKNKPEYLYSNYVYCNEVYVYNRYIDIYKQLAAEIENINECLVIYRNKHDLVLPIASTQYEADDKSAFLFSKNIRHIFRRIRDTTTVKATKDIAKFLLSKHDRAVWNMTKASKYGVITYMPFSKNASAVGYLNKEKLTKYLSSKRKDSNTNLKSFVEFTKIGRVIKSFVGSLFSDTDIEEFVSTYYSCVQDMTQYKAAVVEGEDILKWYSLTSYTTEKKGPLHKSCMRYTDYNTKQRLKFYTLIQNCRLLVITKGGQLYARALLWKLTNGKTYCDRIYATTEVDRKYLEMEAGALGATIFYLDHHAHKDELIVEMDFYKPFLNDNKCCAFPYTDTFRYFTGNLKYLMAKDKNHLTQSFGVRAPYTRNEFNFTSKDVLDINKVYVKDYILPVKISDAVYCEQTKLYYSKEDYYIDENKKCAVEKVKDKTNA